MTIRPAFSGDWQAIGELLDDQLSAEDNQALDGPEFFVAEEAGQVVGCVGLELFQETALLRSLAVVREFQRQRLGEQLIETALADARRTGIARVVLLAPGEGEYFKRFGFQTVAREQLSQAILDSEQFQSARASSAQSMQLELQTRLPPSGSLAGQASTAKER